MKKVEQVDIDGNIFLDYDTSLSPKALMESIAKAFPAIYKDADGMICGQFKGKKFAIRAKNITYLGHPHPLYKKRIQIANDLQVFYKDAIQKGCVPILLGVYTCGDNTLFCDFNIEDFINKKAHNSSAHVYSNDLAEATIDGYFYKEDFFGNKITVFNAQAVGAVLEEKLQLNTSKHSFDYGKSEYCINESKNNTGKGNWLYDYPLTWSRNANRVSERERQYHYNVDFEVGNIEKVVIEFFTRSNRHWYGIECYREMIAANYRNKYQPEWPGFFLEYSFENYLQRNKLNNIIQYAQDKSKGGIDLDLFFPRIGMYGDLKAHSSNSNAIQGNDWDTILGIINNPTKDNHIYYVVCEHDTYKDSDFGYEVTHFWNTVQGKKDIMSYHKRMKNNVELTHA